MTFYVYILFSEQIDKFYVGYSSNPWLRLQQHNSNSSDKYTGRTDDWELRAVFVAGKSESEAIILERFIKQQKSRNLIIQLCDENFVLNGKLAQLVRVPHVRD